jgi:hypothetical protein
MTIRTPSRSDRGQGCSPSDNRPCTYERAAQIIIFSLKEVSLISFSTHACSCLKTKSVMTLSGKSIMFASISIEEPIPDQDAISVDPQIRLDQLKSAESPF